MPRGDPLTVAKLEPAQFLFRQWSNSGQTRRDYARTLGLSPTGLANLLSGSRPTPATLEKLRAHFGDVEALRDVTTWTPAVSVEARAKGLARAHTKKATAKSAASRRGRTRPPAELEHWSESWKASRPNGEPSGYQRSLFALEDAHGREGHGLAVLGRHLQAAARIRGQRQRPGRAQLRAWASHLSPQVGMSTDRILAVWEQALERWEVDGRAGRPEYDQVYANIGKLDDSWPRTEGGFRQDGFWTRAREVAEQLQGHEVDEDALRTQYLRWRRRQQPAAR